MQGPRHCFNVAVCWGACQLSRRSPHRKPAGCRIPASILCCRMAINRALHLRVTTLTTVCHCYPPLSGLADGDFVAAAELGDRTAIIGAAMTCLRRDQPLTDDLSMLKFERPHHCAKRRRSAPNLPGWGISATCFTVACVTVSPSNIYRRPVLLLQKCDHATCALS